MLVLVVGPSGAGKDALLSGARVAFAGDTRIHFARRVITRPVDAGGEEHEAVTEAEFSARDFVLSWSAHGLHYGIPREVTDLAPVIVANVSRGVIEDAARQYAVRVVEVTAPSDVLAARLEARGRETAADIERRLNRSAAIPVGVDVTTVVNGGTLQQGIGRFVAALRSILAARRERCD
jgi:ribose 1,5-bisphosphokinase